MQQPMEAAISEVDQWSTLTGIYHNSDDDFMAQLLHNIDLGLGSGSGSGSSSGSGSGSAWSGIDQTLFYAINSANYFPETGFYDRPVTFPNGTDHHFHDPYLNLMTQHNPVLCGGGSPSVEHDFIEGENYLNHQMEEEEATVVNSLRKRSRSAENVKEMKRTNKLKKNKSSVDLLSKSNSDDDSSESQKNGEALSRRSKKPPLAVNLSGKTRAARGSATDPQSVYARKRRERINERLKTLQNLIPNGTKVDISTMLEEAVLYVKFLQHQIKLLSSDDHWMYAPIAYNGTNVGLDLNLN